MEIKTQERNSNVRIDRYDLETIEEEKVKRFQNISPVTTSVMKKGATGDFKSITVRPGMILHLTEDDIEYTRDNYSPQENSPLEMGWIKEIPEGEKKHPELPDFGKNPNIKTAAEAFAKGREATEELISKIKDQRGLVIMRRALDKEAASLGEVQINQINSMIDRQSDVVDRIHRENAHKYALKG